MSEPLLAARFLFRFAAPCLYVKQLDLEKLASLPEAHRMPNLAELEGNRMFGDVRAAWSQTGIGFRIQVSGKKQPPWCRENRADDSDGVQLWIDTRDTHNIHRASRFCHRFVFLPAGGGRGADQPIADQMLVERARENASPVRPGALQVRSTVKAGGYILCAFLPESALTGFHPTDHPRLGFTYYLFDREFGEQTFSLGSQFPFASDPSLWGTLELVGASGSRPGE